MLCVRYPGFRRCPNIYRRRLSFYSKKLLAHLSPLRFQIFPTITQPYAVELIVVGEPYPPVFGPDSYSYNKSLANRISRTSFQRKGSFRQRRKLSFRSFIGKLSSLTTMTGCFLFRVTTSCGAVSGPLSLMQRLRDLLRMCVRPHSNNCCG